jgi:DNA processing protein
MTDAVYWLWLQSGLGISSALRITEILEAFSGQAKNVYEASIYDRRLAGVFTNLQLNRLEKTALTQAEETERICGQKHIRIITAADVEYPPLLLQIINAPLLLFAAGNLACLRERLPIAMVGTRRADKKSTDIAARLSAELCRAGCVLVSGGALGIDSAAHYGALEAGGETVAVLGCGIDTDYLAENLNLRRRIAKQGAVVSEFPPGTPPAKYHFPVRNRIIAGMCLGTVVVEAGERSGSLITANCANEQGRDVFAVPGDALGSAYTGGNQLIKEGAKPVFSAMDILEEYEPLYPDLLNMRQATRDLQRVYGKPEEIPIETKPKRAVRAKTAAGSLKNERSEPPTAEGRTPKEENLVLSGSQQTILLALQKQPLQIDEIQRSTGLAAGELATAILMLEMDGRIAQSPGKIYALS